MLERMGHSTTDPVNRSHLNQVVHPNPQFSPKSGAAHGHRALEFIETKRQEARAQALGNAALTVVEAIRPSLDSTAFHRRYGRTTPCRCGVSALHPTA